jgi:uncharacterized protein (TIGR04255 family)
MPTSRQPKHAQRPKSDLPAKPGTLFSNPPLKEAAFEVRFNPLLKIQRDLSIFQERIAAQYPVLGKENAPVGSEPLETFLFKSEDTKNIVRVSIRSFGFSTLAYRGYAPFKKELLEKTELFCDCFGIESFKRVGLRYINNIEVEEHQGQFNFTDFVRPLIDVTRLPIREISRFAQEIALRKDDGQLTIRSGLIPLPMHGDNGSKKAIFVLDLDFDTEEPPGIKQLSSLVDNFHTEVEMAFLGQITSAMVDRMNEEARS